MSKSKIPQQSADASESQDSNNLPPEKRLLAAILERAILDAAGTDAKQLKHDNYNPETTMRGASGWLRLDQEHISAQELRRPRVMSFVWVCQHLEFDPLVIREHVRLRVSEIAADYKSKNIIRQHKIPLNNMSEISSQSLKEFQEHKDCTHNAISEGQIREPQGQPRRKQKAKADSRTAHAFSTGSKQTTGGDA